MADAETRAWWSEVEHLREPLQQRRRARTPQADPREGPRRTVRIRGQAVPGAPSRRLHVSADETGVAVGPRRPPRRPIERLGSRPDRIAGWAVGFGLLLVIVAAITGHG